MRSPTTRKSSELGARGSPGEDAPSSAWWSLYKARSGAWFEVAADHDGVVDSVTALSPEEAQAGLERQRQSSRRTTFWRHAGLGTQ